MRKTIKFTIVIIFLFTFGIFYKSLNKDNQYNTQDLVGQKLENITFKNFENNNTTKIEGLINNNFILINFWASWCGPCRAEHPTLMKLNSNKKISIIGVNFKDKKKNAKMFLKELGNPYDFITEDKEGKLSINFGIYGIPESILINKELLILQKFIGPLTTEDYNKISDIIY